MPQDSSPRKPGDSAPNFDFLNEQDGAELGGRDSGGDSAVGVLPAGEHDPEEAALPSPDQSTEEEKPTGESPSSIFSDAVPTREDEGYTPPEELAGPDEATLIAPESFSDVEPPMVPDDSVPAATAAEADPADEADDTLHVAGMAGIASTADEETVRMEAPADMTDPPRHRRSEAAASSGRNDAGDDSKQRLNLIILASYASAVTLIAIYLWMRLAAAAAHPHHLESLPDVKPIPEGQFSEYDAAATMPPGHTLQLGDSRQFGNIRVDVLRISREPVEFAHFSGDSKRWREASQPVLKLWLRFTNVSDDQVIVPVDAELLLKRAVNSSGKMLANNFVIRASDKPAGGPRVFLYDHPLTSEWDLKEQNLGLALKPGESLETYVPSAVDGLEDLEGNLLWRVHFRKGHSPRGYGVTTLIEVAFSRSDVAGGDTQTQSS